MDRKALVYIYGTMDTIRAIEIIRAAETIRAVEIVRAIEITRVSIIKVFIFITI